MKSAAFIRRSAVTLLFAASVLCASWGKQHLRAAAIPQPDTPLYLPEAPYVRLVTLGYDTFFSDILWFKTISYFGKQFQGAQDYRWLAHMCSLVTSLDPQAVHVYEFCGTLLSWTAAQPERSTEILTKGIQNNPEQWRLWYLRGFNYWYFLKRRDLAKDDLAHAAQIDDAPSFLASLASRLMTDVQSPDVAIAFLSDMRMRAKDDNVRAALDDKLKRAVLSRDQRLLQRAAALYRERFGREVQQLEDLVAAGILRAIPAEPFGGRYYWDSPAQKILNSSNERGLEFGGNTVETGAFSRDQQRGE